MWQANGSTVNLPRGKGAKRQLDRFKKTLHSWWKKGIAKPISIIDSFVKHVYREHNQEADYWANIGAQRRRKLSSIDVISQQCGRRYEASGMEASETMEEAGMW